MAKKSIESHSAEVYIPFVQSLFRDGKTLALGVFVQTLATLLVYSENGHPIYLVTALILVATGLIRLAGIQYQNNAPPPTTVAEAKRMEWWYILFASLHAAALGFFCFAGIYLAHSQFAELASVSITLATVSSIVGRNYGSARMVTILILMMMAPYSLALIMRGGFYHVTLGLLCAPFFLAISALARRVRTVLRDAVLAQISSERLAKRFDKALNTMSHGLVMFDQSRKVVVINDKAVEFFSFRTREAAEGRSLSAMIMRAEAAGLFEEADTKQLNHKLESALLNGKIKKVQAQLRDGRHIEFTVRGREKDFDVITFEDVTARIKAEAQILHMARYDSLTNLASRAFFVQTVSELLNLGDRERNCAFILIDLDDFKHINDTLGHPIGDGLIYGVAERLREVVSPTVRLARFGGDEFLFYIDNIRDDRYLDLLVSDIFSKFESPIDVGGHMLQINLSAGAAIEKAGDFDVNQMTVHADLALYQAKEGGKNRWRIFEDAMEAEFLKRQTLKNELRMAIANDILRVVYQPIVNAKTMRISTCEALCRWDHETMGPISPAVFIPLAEEMGIVSKVTKIMLRKACQDCMGWPESTSVSVNLSARDFKEVDIVEMISQALRETGLDPVRLEVEVTETALLDNQLDTARILESLKALGVRVALDDFGTGYSSLSYLHRLPLDKVKIDQAFIREILVDERSMALVRSVAAMCREMDLKVTIEGVETEEQLMALSEFVSVDQVQGYLFGPSLPAEGVARMAKHTWPYQNTDRRVATV